MVDNSARALYTRAPLPAPSFHFPFLSLSFFPQFPVQVTLPSENRSPWDGVSSYVLSIGNNYFYDIIIIIIKNIYSFYLININEKNLKI